MHAGFARDYVGFCVAGEAPPLERMLAHDCGRLVARALRLGVRAAVNGQPQAASGARRRQYNRLTGAARRARTARPGSLCW